MASKIAIWACSARCADGKDRTVLAFYKGERCLLVQRPWIAPTTTLLLDPGLHCLIPFLRALVSVADYHVYRDVWYGEVAANWHVVAALTGLSRGTIDTQLKSMSYAGLILYHPGHSSFRPPLIRIFPYQKQTGIHLIEPEASWTRRFVTTVTPKTMEIEIEPQGDKGRVHSVRRLGARAAQNRVCDLVSEAPIFISDKDYSDPNSWVHSKVTGIMPGNADAIRTICGVPGLEDMANMNCGVDPAVGYDREGPVTPESVAAAKKEDAVNWRSNWSESGVGVVVSKEISEPVPGQFGVVPSWELVSDAPVSTQTPAAGVAPSALSQTPAAGVGLPTDTDTNELMKSDDISNHPADPNGWGQPTGAGAPVAGKPAPGAVPSASQDFIRSKPERQLNQEQINGLYRQRGPRVTDQQRRSMTTQEVSCVETYERLTGVPFCREDMKHLQSALTLTSHMLVLRGIRYSSTWPNPPGYFVMKDGFAHVLRAIEHNRFLHVKAKKSRTKVKVTSGLADDVKERPLDLGGPGTPSIAAVSSEKGSAVAPGRAFVPPTNLKGEGR